MNGNENNQNNRYDYHQMTEGEHGAASSFGSSNNANSSQSQLASSEQALLAILGGGLQQMNTNNANPNGLQRNVYRPDGSLNVPSANMLNTSWSGYNPNFVQGRYDTPFQPYLMSQHPSHSFAQPMMGSTPSTPSQHSNLSSMGLPPQISSTLPSHKQNHLTQLLEQHPAASTQFSNAFSQRSAVPEDSASIPLHPNQSFASTSTSFPNLPYSLDPSQVSTQQLLSTYREQVPSTVRPYSFRTADSFLPSQILSTADLSKHVDMDSATMPSVSVNSNISPAASSFPVIPSAPTTSPMASATFFEPAEFTTPHDQTSTVEHPRSLLEWSSQMSSHTTPIAGASVPVSSLKSFYRLAHEAAKLCNLDPAALEPFEKQMLSDRLQDSLVLFHYLQIRNSICWLWRRNPTLPISKVEAQGVCADRCLFPLAILAYEFLVRYGYINYGCLSFESIVTPNIQNTSPSPQEKQKTIIVVGAGLTGLACARHLTSLFTQFSSSFSSKGEAIPKIILLESKQRTGGRIYSRVIPSMNASFTDQDVMQDLPNVSEAIDFGFQFLTSGADNVLFTLIEQQLGLQTLPLEGVDLLRNDQDNKMFDISDSRRLGTLWTRLLQLASLLTNESNDTPVNNPFFQNFQSFLDEICPNHEHGPFVTENTPHLPFKQILVFLIQKINSYLKLSSEEKRFLTWCMISNDADDILHASKSSPDWNFDLGNLTPRVVKNGLSQLSWALQSYPYPLNIQYGKSVCEIKNDISKCYVHCTDSSVYEADHVVMTCSPYHLTSDIKIQPTLPSQILDNLKSTQYAPGRKLILRYTKVFWKKDIRSFGVLPLIDNIEDSLSFPATESSIPVSRIWNMFPVTEQPILVADVLETAVGHSNEGSTLIQTLNSWLMNHFADQTNDSAELLDCWEVNWSNDNSMDGLFVQKSNFSDSSILQKGGSFSLGCLHFVGDYTQPATSGSSLSKSYLAGISVCTGIINDLAQLGLALPVMGETARNELEEYMLRTTTKQYDTDTEVQRHLSYRARYRLKRQERLDEHKEESELLITELLGYLPEPPIKPSANPFLLYQKMQWHVCRALADDEKKKLTGDSEARATINEIRAKLGKSWRQLDDLGKKPWVEEIAARREAYAGKNIRYQQLAKEYELRAEQIRNDHSAKARDEPIPEDETRLYILAQREEAEQKNIVDEGDGSQSAEGSDEEYRDDGGSSDSGGNAHD
ncbi:histone demethylase SWIRM2 [Schizosaccharomyces cryophilus OY26]|uniref:Histone demethylase SWIRM2 n=1 Tax=Schizosaccharomyces cryophilus (strain OY26 / ATCC MYA-4695 / CBS 11777 / NBRC 106824 / NRRL Y48691) TaxID=653667 RepID=S9WY62_SCHCR|nr:histone demethylase SWIRM2 [Schizosaccharomyces cryophilus OY26]EPY49672.1 histone demethylase SWIRM2 [Schizosaccharomyces cryophilus OY26]